jgi:hypothetical protein
LSGEVTALHAATAASADTINTLKRILTSALPGETTHRANRALNEQRCAVSISPLRSFSRGPDKDYLQK